MHACFELLKTQLLDDSKVARSRVGQHIHACACPVPWCCTCHAATPFLMQQSWQSATISNHHPSNTPWLQQRAVDTGNGETSPFYTNNDTLSPNNKLQPNRGHTKNRSGTPPTISTHLQQSQPTINHPLQPPHPQQQRLAGHFNRCQTARKHKSAMLGPRQATVVTRVTSADWLHKCGMLALTKPKCGTL